MLVALIFAALLIACRRDPRPEQTPSTTFDTAAAMRIMFGNFDPVIKSSLFQVPDGAESNPNFVQKDQIRVRPFFVEDLNEGETRRVYMLTWAKPAGQPFDCNGCVPLIAAGIFINGPNGWQAESVNRAAISYGNFGKPPEGRLVEIGPGHRAFLLHLTSTTEATTESEALLVPWKGSVVEAMRIVMADSNDGNCGGAYPCYKNQRELKFVPGSNPDYNDIVLTLSGTDMPPNPPYKVHDVRGTQRLRFQEGKYVPIEKSGDTISAEARK